MSMEDAQVGFNDKEGEAPKEETGCPSRSLLCFCRERFVCSRVVLSERGGMGNELKKFELASPAGLGAFSVLAAGSIWGGRDRLLGFPLGGFIEIRYPVVRLPLA